LEFVESIPGEINGQSKEANPEEAKQAAALDDARLEAIEGVGGAAQGVRDSPSAASHGARCPVEGSHRRDLPRDAMTLPPLGTGFFKLIERTSAMNLVMRLPTAGDHRRITVTLLVTR
jgi:hypothetical protein